MLKAYQSIICKNKLQIFKPLPKKLRKYTPFTQSSGFCFSHFELDSTKHVEAFEVRLKDNFNGFFFNFSFKLRFSVVTPTHCCDLKGEGFKRLM